MNFLLILLGVVNSAGDSVIKPNGAKDADKNILTPDSKKRSFDSENDCASKVFRKFNCADNGDKPPISFLNESVSDHKTQVEKILESPRKSKSVDLSEKFSIESRDSSKFTPFSRQSSTDSERDGPIKSFRKLNFDDSGNKQLESSFKISQVSVPVSPRKKTKAQVEKVLEPRKFQSLEDFNTENQHFNGMDVSSEVFRQLDFSDDDEDIALELQGLAQISPRSSKSREMKEILYSLEETGEFQMVSDLSIALNNSKSISDLRRYIIDHILIFALFFSQKYDPDGAIKKQICHFISHYDDPEEAADFLEYMKGIAKQLEPKKIISFS
jgi:hypothetical protein